MTKPDDAKRENNGHFWTCPACKKYNLFNRMFCTGCGYSGYYAPTMHQCTKDCKAIQAALIDTYNVPLNPT